MNFEWQIPDPSMPVRQGDLLICRDPHTGLVEEICIVITADCDISKGKFGRQLACLRVISFVDYLRTIWADRKLCRAVDTETEKIRIQLAKWHSRRIGVDSNLSASAATAWVQRAEPEAICAELEIPEPDIKKVKATLTAFKAGLALLQGDKSTDKFKCLVEFRSGTQGKNLQNCRQELIKQAQTDLLPDDVFLLPNLPQIDCGSAVVLLREIVSVPHETVCYRTVDASTNEMFLRIGRLEPTFKYAVSHAFGSLYSRIGLPVEYERQCKEAIEQINEITLE